MACAPSGIRRLFGCQRLLERLLNRVENARLLRRQVAREVVQKSLLRQLAPIVIEDNAGCGRGRRIVLCQRRIVLAGIGCPRSDVDEGGDLRVHPHIRHDHSGEGMADEHRRARLRRDYPPRGLRRLMQRGQRILNTRAVDALLLETGDDLRPTGAVCEQSVYEDYILRLQRCLGAGDSIEQGKGDAGCDSPDQFPAKELSASLVEMCEILRDVLAKNSALPTSQL